MAQKYKTNYLRYQKKKRFKAKMFLFLFFIFLSGLVYLTIFSNIFKIKKIEIVGAKRVPSEVIYENVKTFVEDDSVWPMTNNLLFANVGLKQKILIPDIEKINISKNYFSKTLKVRVFEKQPIAEIIFEKKGIDLLNQIDDKTIWYFDNDGYVFQSDLKSDLILPKITIINFHNQQNKKILDSFALSNFSELIKYFKENNFYFPENLKFSYSFNTPSSITYHYNDNFDIYITLNKDIIEAFKTADEFAKKENNEKNLIFNYIDVRFYPEKLYYK